MTSSGAAKIAPMPLYSHIREALRGPIREEPIAARDSELKDGGLTGFGMDVGPSGLESVV